MVADFTPEWQLRAAALEQGGGGTLANEYFDTIWGITFNLCYGQLIDVTLPLDMEEFVIGLKKYAC